VAVHAICKLRLTAIAWMTNMARGYSQIRKRDLSIPSDCYDRSGLKRIEKPHQQRPAGLAFFACVTAVRHRVVPFMRMKRENVPEENRSLQIFENLPNHCGRSLGNGRTFCRPRQRRRSKELRVIKEMDLVGKREASSPSAAVTKVARYPHGLHPTAQGCAEDELKIAAADSRRIRPIVLIAGISVWVEDAVKFQRGYVLDEIVDLEGTRLHLNGLLIPTTSNRPSSGFSCKSLKKFPPTTREATGKQVTGPHVVLLAMQAGRFPQPGSRLLRDAEKGVRIEHDSLGILGIGPCREFTAGTE
jgi:hypothetical protein